jgi:carbonic anhydrase
MHKSLVLTGLLMAATSAIAQSPAPRVERVLTQAEQEALTPDQVLQALKEGNRRFVSGTVTSRDHSAQVRDAVGGQFPKAMILSCVDSRIPVEDVFDRGIGDVFVARVAGNFENVDILGSMEFATRISGAKLVLVLGHEHCGAIHAAIDGAELGNITGMLKSIRPAVEALSDYAGEQTSANSEFVHLVAEKNVRMTIDDIRERSPILKEMEEKGQLKIAGALYDMDTGTIDFLE